MARYTGPVCKLCRREGQKLFLKGERCYFKCAFERRSYAPGQHGQSREKLKDYGIRLREKQKIRRIYGIFEKQFRRYFYMAERQKGVTGENLLRILESRLDNIVYRSGLASSRPEARQLVLHNHFTVNDKKVNIPSYQVKDGDVIKVKEKSKGVDKIVQAMESAQQRGTPEWMDIDQDKMEVLVRVLPSRDQIPESIEEQLV
ncbi:30S ribosomal protein S4, partial [Candidatus Poribacteria bacterium]|nr:30S ribosomal protein S4 [Candidatus Poribacteria bacterium]